jgi:hypothetical protein
MLFYEAPVQVYKRGSIANERLIGICLLFRGPGLDPDLPLKIGPTY